MDNNIIKQYMDIAEEEYKFPGVLFESVVEWLAKESIEDVSEYLDVLYSNNPFLLSKIPIIISDKQVRNDICRYTHIYERFIVKSVNKSAWEKTKELTSFLYKNNKKSILFEELSAIMEDPEEYVKEMKQKGFLDEYCYDGQTEFLFAIDSLADYLLARNLFDDLKGKSLEDCIKIVKNKAETFYSASEAFILALFNKFNPQYKLIKKILRESGLMERFNYEVATKIHINNEYVSGFIKEFKPKNSAELLLYFGGYNHTPFNCVNYLNEIFLKNENDEVIELSSLLSQRFIPGNIKIRLKNILYFTCKCMCKQEVLRENFYMGLWCTAAGNTDIRNLSRKLLFETTQRNVKLIDELIEIYPSIEDYYIKEAIIHTLSCCQQIDAIKTFFEEIVLDTEFLQAKSIRRIETYLGKKYKWIELTKRDLTKESAEEISNEFSSFLLSVDLYETTLLPFRYWSATHVDLAEEFIKANKNEISEFNSRLKEDFVCVKNGFCNGILSFEKDVQEKYHVKFGEERIDATTILMSLENVLKRIFKQYRIPLKSENIFNKLGGFSSSQHRKCLCIALDLLYGSLMCNYYSATFGTYNNYQNSIGYEVFDPLPEGEDIYITTPLSVFQTKIAKMGDHLVKKLILRCRKMKCGGEI